VGAGGHRGRGRCAIANSDTESYAITNSFTPSMRPGNSNTYTHGDGHGYGNTYTNGNTYCDYNAIGYTNRNSKRYAQADSYTTPASYYAAAASVGLEMLIADSR
jgi:hypothetical protein